MEGRGRGRTASISLWKALGEDGGTADGTAPTNNVAESTVFPLNPTTARPTLNRFEGALH